jgi:hypothetical protein
LRATPTKLSQNPSHLRQSPCPTSCTARIAIAAVITTAACTATFTAAVLFHFLPRSRVACTLHLSSPVSPFSSFLPLRCCRSSLSLCHSLRVASACVLCPAPLSPFGPSCPEPRKAKPNRAWPHGPRCPPALLAPPLLLPSLLPPVYRLSVLVVSSFAIFFFTASPLLPRCRSSLFLCRSLLVASACVLLY